MAYADGARTQLSYVAEVTHGTTPGSPSMKTLRCLGREINLKKGALVAEEIRADRQIADLRHGARRVDGSVPFELCLSAHDDMIEGAMGSSWTAIAQVTPVSVLAGLFHRASGSFVTDKFRVGSIIATAGFSAGNNNGQWRVTVVAASDLTVVKYADGSAPGLSTETATSQTLDLTGKYIDIGTTLKTFTFERGFLDIVQYEPYVGVTVNDFMLAVKPDSITKVTLGLLGMDASAGSGTSLGTPAAAATNSPMSAFQGELVEGGTKMAIATGLDLGLRNNRSLTSVIGSAISPDVNEGRAVISGTLTALFPDLVLYNKFVNETESALVMRCVDPTDVTKFLNFVVPRLKYTGADKTPPKEGPIIVTAPFQGLVDSVTGQSMWVQRSNVS